jgi:hypothetical protein
MAMKDRTRGIHELHGVVDIEEETPMMLRSKLQQVTKVVRSFGNGDDTAAYMIDRRWKRIQSM